MNNTGENNQLQSACLIKDFEKDRKLRLKDRVFLNENEPLETVSKGLSFNNAVLHSNFFKDLAAAYYNEGNVKFAIYYLGASKRFSNYLEKIANISNLSE